MRTTKDVRDAILTPGTVRYGLEPQLAADLNDAVQLLRDSVDSIYCEKPGDLAKPDECKCYSCAASKAIRAFLAELKEGDANG